MAAMSTRGFFSLLPFPASLKSTLSVSISESKTTNHSCCVHFGGCTAYGKRSRVRLGWEARTVRPSGWVFGSGERERRRWSRRLSGDVSGVICCEKRGCLLRRDEHCRSRDGYAIRSTVERRLTMKMTLGHATRGGGSGFPREQKTRPRPPDLGRIWPALSAYYVHGLRHISATS